MAEKGSFFQGNFGSNALLSLEYVLLLQLSLVTFIISRPPLWLLLLTRAVSCSPLHKPVLQSSLRNASNTHRLSPLVAKRVVVSIGPRRASRVCDYQSGVWESSAGRSHNSQD